MTSVFESLLEVPIDASDVPDGDDSLVPNEQASFLPQVPLGLASRIEATRTLAVPYRELHFGSRGNAVVALKRSLSRAGHGNWLGRQFTQLLGVFTVRHLKAFQKKQHLPQTGRYDRATHSKLAPHYDAFSLAYLFPHTTPDQQKRNRFVGSLMYLYNHRGQLPYTQARAYDLRKPPWRGLDCSSSGEWAGWDSGLGSLSGFSGQGYGNTWSQLEHFNRRSHFRPSVQYAEQGDAIYYGRGNNPSHVAYWIGDGRVWSFGSYPIKILDYDYRHDRIAICNLTGVT